MATSITFNGSTYSVPANREPRGWGTSLSAFLVDVGNNALSKAGGNFTLTADANFGSTYGLVVKYIKSASSNIAQSGVARFANNEGLAWRNAANNADLALTVDTNNRLSYGGVVVPTISSGDTITNKIISGASNTLTVRLDNTDVTGTLPASKGGTGVTSLGTGVATALGQNTTGSGGMVLATSPTLVSPNLGTPNTGNLSNCTGLPIDAGTTGTLPASRGGTGVTSLGTGIATFLGTPSSANLRAALTDETGTGPAVFADSPVFTTKLNLPDGSVSIPALAFLSDEDGSGTGIYRVGANNGGFAANGVNVGGWSSTAWDLGPTSGDGYYTKINRLYRLVRTTNYNVAGTTPVTATQLTSSVVNASYLRLVTASGAFNLDGIVALTDGTVLMIENQTGQVMTVRHNGAGEGTSANQINTATSGSITFPDGSVAMFMYSSGKAKWLLVNKFA